MIIFSKFEVKIFSGFSIWTPPKTKRWQREKHTSTHNITYTTTKPLTPLALEPRCCSCCCWLFLLLLHSWWHPPSWTRLAANMHRQGHSVWAWRAHTHTVSPPSPTTHIHTHTHRNPPSFLFFFFLTGFLKMFFFRVQFNANLCVDAQISSLFNGQMKLKKWVEGAPAKKKKSLG